MIHFLSIDKKVWFLRYNIGPSIDCSKHWIREYTTGDLLSPTISHRSLTDEDRTIAMHCRYAGQGWQSDQCTAVPESQWQASVVGTDLVLLVLMDIVSIVQTETMLVGKHWIIWRLFMTRLVADEAITAET